MKRIMSILLIVITMMSVALVGCKKDEALVDYQINSEDTLNIGVLLTDSEAYKASAQKVLDGINFAAETASKINIDREYSINLIVKYDSDIDSAYDEFVESKVCSIICMGGYKQTTDIITEKFKNTQIPLVFVDNTSSSITECTNTFSLGIDYAYRVAAVAGYISEQGNQNGALVIAYDDGNADSFANLLSSTLSNSGLSLAKYSAVSDEPDYSSGAIAAADYDFVVVYGDTSNAMQTAEELKTAGVQSEIILDEVMDKIMLEADLYEDVAFLSKFEYDDENYIGSDFINVYSDEHGTSVSDNNAATAYGYDAYMLIYEVLRSFSTGGDGLLSVVSGSNGTAQDAYTATIYVGEVLNAFSSVTYYGVTDEITFNSQGLCAASFVYVDKIQGQSAIMVEKFRYNND